MREDWVKLRLKDIAIDYGRGKSKHRPRNDPILYGGEYPFIQTGDVRNANHFITSHSQRYSDAGLAQSKLWPRGTVCITIAANIAESGVLDFDACFPDSVIGIVCDETKALNRFVEFMLQFVKMRLRARGKGSAQDNINLGTFQTEFFAFPSVTEQKRIVAFLDEAFEGIDRAVANTEKNLANARELFDSHLNAVFSQKGERWVELKFGEVCGFFNGFAFKSSDAIKKSSVQLVRMGNLYKNSLDLKRKPSFYPENFEEAYARFVLKAGDIIMSLTGTVGKEDYGYAVEIPETETTLLLNQRITKIINARTDLLDNSALLYFLHSRVFLDNLYQIARGVRQANLSTETMKKLPISLPPVEEQRSLIAELKVLENGTARLQETNQRKLSALYDLKQSILQKAFAGELTTEPDRVLAEAGA